MNCLLQYDEAKETASVLAFLAHMMNYYPDEAFVDKLRENYKGDSTDSAEIEEFWQKYKDSEKKDIVQDLAVEWVRLFRGTAPGSGQEPPYAGVFISKDGIGTDIMLALKFMYDSHGFTPAKKDRMDYLGIMLDFMGGLLSSYASFAEIGQQDEANSCLVTMKELCSKYITPWLEHFVNKSLKNAKNPLYREYLYTILDTVNSVTDVLKQE